MSNKQYLKYSELAHAAYINFEAGEDPVWKILYDGGDEFSESQAISFAQTCKVIDQYNGMVEEIYIKVVV